MNSKLIAKIKAPDTAGKSSIGTGYPISPEWVITARHVVEFKDRNTTAPIMIEWPSHEPVKVTEVKELGNDIALLKCVVPVAIGTPIFSPICMLPEAQTGWISAGYPDVNDCERYDAMGKFGVDFGEPTISLTLDDTCREDKWGGMSGAPVFKGDRLCAVITVHDQRMGKRLVAVSIPWLLANDPEFRQAVGYSENNRNQQFALVQLLCYLKSINDTPLFQALAGRWVGGGLQPTHFNLLNGIEELVKDDPITALEQLRKVCELVMKDDRASVQQTIILLCFVLGLVATAADGQAENKGVHQLAVRTRLMVEAFLASRYRVRPDLVHEEATDPNDRVVVGRYAMGGECLPEVGWTPEANAEGIVKVVDLVVNKTHERAYGHLPKNKLDEFGEEELNETLLTRRTNDDPQLIRFEVASSDKLKDTHPLHDDAVCAALHRRLPDLPIVRYGLGVAAKEAKLSAQVNEFFRIILKYS